MFGGGGGGGGGEESCWLSRLVGEGVSLVDVNGTSLDACAVQSRSSLVGLLVASSVCEACVSLRPLLVSVSSSLQLVLLSRDPSAPRFARHLLSLGPGAAALSWRSAPAERLNEALNKPPLPSLFVHSAPRDDKEGSLLDEHGAHALLRLGAQGAIEHWRQRRDGTAQRVDHRALFLAEHPPSPGLLAKLQPAANAQEEREL